MKNCLTLQKLIFITELRKNEVCVFKQTLDIRNPKTLFYSFRDEKFSNSDKLIFITGLRKNDVSVLKQNVDIRNQKPYFIIIEVEKLPIVPKIDFRRRTR